ncbi:MAG: hypothetical protein LBC74_08460 [Planctomycetaceae bacterium]|jgi:hypothetical protein|nr:hypothetical protein [Planctomycetaceae bacterium]
MLENNDDSCKSNFSVHPNTPDAPVCPFSFESLFEQISLVPKLIPFFLAKVVFLAVFIGMRFLFFELLEFFCSFDIFAVFQRSVSIFALGKNILAT